jgi:hypothetical protein
MGGPISSAVGPQSAEQQLFQQRRAQAYASARANDDEQQEAEPEGEVGCGGDDEAKESFEFCADGERGDGDY